MLDRSCLLVQVNKKSYNHVGSVHRGVWVFEVYFLQLQPFHKTRLKMDKSLLQNEEKEKGKIINKMDDN